MAEFPSFMRNNGNAIRSSDQSPGIEGFVFDGIDGMQMAYWTTVKSGISKEHVHEYDEYMIVVEGSYVMVIGGKEIPLTAGMEHTIPAGIPHSGRYAAGTRTIHCFGGKRAKRRVPSTSYECPLITVEDMSRSREFYVSLLDQKVKDDHGEMVTFANTFAIMDRSHFMKTARSEDRFELYFETDYLEGKRDLLREKGIPFVHDIEMQPWGQKVFRVRDPDGYLIEIGERP